MKQFISGQCPVCHSKLHIARLACNHCRAEFPADEELSPFDYLDDSMRTFLLTFLKCEGSVKAVGEALKISYPTVKKRYSELMIALGLHAKDNKQNKPWEGMNMNILNNLNRKSRKASDIVRNKLCDSNGIATFPLQKGGLCEIRILPDGSGFESEKLPGQKILFEIFDTIADFLKSQGGEAPKGTARGPENRIGMGKCGEETVTYQIATKDYDKKEGETSCDPLFVLAGIMEWAGIAENGYGYLKLLNP